MLIPVKCFTCGKVLGDKYLAYQEEVIKVKVERQINPDKIVFSIIRLHLPHHRYILVLDRPHSLKTLYP